MFVVYSEAHRQHDPPFEIAEGGTKQPIFEAPARMDRICAALDAAGWAEYVVPSDHGLAPILAVHDADYVDFLRTGYDRWRAEAAALGDHIDPTVLLGTVWPPRRTQGRPATAAGQAGFYAMDTACPIVAGTYAAALTAAHCALTGAHLLTAGEQAVFALCRPRPFPAPGKQSGQTRQHRRQECGGSKLGRSRIGCSTTGRQAAGVAFARYCGQTGQSTDPFDQSSRDDGGHGHLSPVR